MIETKNARILSTMLGTEDHGILTCWLHLEYDGSGQGFGGYALDAPNGKRNTDFKRIGCAWGMQLIKAILETVGVEKWEDLPGKYIRVMAEHSKVHGIGHIIKENWFAPESDETLLSLKPAEAK